VLIECVGCIGCRHDDPLCVRCYRASLPRPPGAVRQTTLPLSPNPNRSPLATKAPQSPKIHACCNESVARGASCTGESEQHPRAALGTQGRLCAVLQDDRGGNGLFRAFARCGEDAPDRWA
jgi:hypothetical protein